MSAPLNVLKSGSHPDDRITVVDRHDMSDHLADSGADEVILVAGRFEGSFAENSSGEHQFAGLGFGLEFLFRLEGMQRHGQIVDAVFDKTLVLENELNLGNFFVRIPEERIDLAIEVKLDALLRFGGAHEPESGGAQGKQRSEAARHRGPALDQVERRRQKHGSHLKLSACELSESIAALIGTRRRTA
jgi:hypothetical protein